MKLLSTPKECWEIRKKMNAKEKYVLQGIQIFEFIRSNIFQTNAGDMYATHSE